MVKRTGNKRCRSSKRKRDAEFEIRLLLLFNCPVVYDFLQSHGLQLARPLCPSPSVSFPKFMSIASVMP